ncbi:hypothetical protein DRW07_04820 [Alteromonas sediminis]|uniref:PEP-CTERM sorting domain-containing protein n=1 Tax=Alteromonas sediminis TaxID=2259342 RepID=A0A3N5YAS2_9ALTE|nr:hypothetical protein [Alteromonas sediminis]RPJ68719.1 hypothetical protein DRW07_04820 [Alteromonas sediminis]
MLKIKGISLLVSLSLLSFASNANLFTGSEIQPNEIQKKSWHWFNTEDLNTLSGTEKYRFVKGCFTLTTVCITSFTDVEPIPDGPLYPIQRDANKKVLSEEELYTWNAAGSNSWDQVLGATEGDSRRMTILGAQSFGSSRGQLTGGSIGQLGTLGFGGFPGSTDSPIVRTDLPGLTRPAQGSGTDSQSGNDPIASTGSQSGESELPGNEPVSEPNLLPEAQIPPSEDPVPSTPEEEGGTHSNTPETGTSGGEQPEAGDPEPSGGKKPVLPGDPPVIDPPLLEAVAKTTDEKTLQVVSEPPVWLFPLLIFIALYLLKDRRGSEDGADAVQAAA